MIRDRSPPRVRGERLAIKEQFLDGKRGLTRVYKKGVTLTEASATHFEKAENGKTAAGLTLLPALGTTLGSQETQIRVTPASGHPSPIGSGVGATLHPCVTLLKARVFRHAVRNHTVGLRHGSRISLLHLSDL